MSQVPLAPPPPTSDTLLGRWLYLLWKRLTATGQILWETISFTGSDLNDLETRNHNDLQNLDAGDYHHLTAAQYADLTDGGTTTLHSHAAGPSTVAASVTVADAASDTTTYVLLAGSATGDLPVLSDSGLTYNASTNVLGTGPQTVTGQSGNAVLETLVGTGNANIGIVVRATDASGSVARAVFWQAENESSIAIGTITCDISTDGSSKWNFLAQPSGTRTDRRANVMQIYGNGNIAPTSGTTAMASGFFHIPAAAGAPTGAPTNPSGTVPMYYDTTNNHFYVYNGAWKKVALT